MCLGVKIERDRYEEDPSKWPRSSGRTKATVHFEWTNLAERSGAPYRTFLIANNGLQHSRNFPKGPLSASAPSVLIFTVDYAEALGKAVHEGIEFKGIAYESDAPTLLKQLQMAALIAKTRRCTGRCPMGDA